MFAKRVRLRDPLTLAILGMGVYVLVVAGVLLGALNGMPAAVAASIDGESEDFEARPAPPEETIEVEIADGSSAGDILSTLAEAGLVQDVDTLRVLLGFTGGSSELQAGRYEFGSNLPASEVLRVLRLGPNLVEMITFREGLRVQEIGEILEDEEIATAEEWEAALAEPREARHEAFLDARPEGADLTGYLLPATYPIEEETTALDLLNAMLDAFAEQVTDEMVEEATEQGLTLHEVLTLASIVEREAVHPEERPTIAAVFRNRYDIGMALQADPTVQYAITVEGPEMETTVYDYGWWKLGLTVGDLEVDSPYNTYIYAGLPPGPIANPGFDSILSVIRPAQTEYIYFVAHPDCDGHHLFAEDFAEHEQNVVAFRASECAEE